MTDLILASTSPYRKAQLAQLCLPFSTCAPGVDEEPYKQRITNPDELARVLSQAKADAVASRYSDAIVIAGDQVADIDGMVLDKPGTPERAVAQLQQLSGKTHYLWSGLAVAYQGQTDVFLARQAMTMRALSLQEIERYVQVDQSWDCCGAYKIESLGIALFSSIEGEDHTAITGVPLITLVNALEARGIRVLEHCEVSA